MRRDKSFVYAVLLVLVFLLSSCTFQNMDTSFDKKSLEEEYLEAKEKAGITAARIEEVKDANADNYAYSVMRYELHDVYAELYLIVMNEYEDIMISTDSVDDLKYAFQCMLNDHPEIFWVDGYSYSIPGENLGGNLLFSGRYTYDLNEIRVKQVAISNYVSMCMAGLKHGADEYETVKYIYDYVITGTEYELGAADNQNILSVFEGGKSVCQGYAKAIQYLLNYKGIACTYVTGKVYTGEGHGWNLVNIDGAYYYLDATWGDASFTQNQKTAKYGLPVNYDYLNVTTKEIQKTHIIDSIVPMPSCISLEANYFVHEGRYFTDINEEHFKDAFEKAYNDGEGYVILKADGDYIFSEIKSYLIDERNIFLYLKDTTAEVTYFINDDTDTICFWL